MLAVVYLSLALAALDAPEPDMAPKPVEVELEAPEGCSGAQAFYDSLRSRTDRVRRASGREARSTLQVRLSRVHGHVLGELRMVDDRGGTDTRRVQGATCDEVVQALSLTAALALDPTAVVSLLGPTPDTDTAASSAPTPPLAPAVQPTPAERAPAGAREEAGALAERLPGSGLAAELAVGPVAMTVIAGNLSPGVALAARKHFQGGGGFRPVLGLAVLYVRNDLLGSPAVTQASLAGLSGGVCPLRWSVSRFSFQPCASLLGGWLSASGRQLTHVSTVNRSWLSVGGTVRAAVWLRRQLALELETGISAPLLKRRFFATLPSNIVAETPTLSPMVGLALTYGI